MYAVWRRKQYGVNPVLKTRRVEKINVDLSLSERLGVFLKFQVWKIKYGTYTAYSEYIIRFSNHLNRSRESYLVLHNILILWN